MNIDILKLIELIYNHGEPAHADITDTYSIEYFYFNQKYFVLLGLVVREYDSIDSMISFESDALPARIRNQEDGTFSMRIYGDK